MGCQRSVFQFILAGDYENLIKFTEPTRKKNMLFTNFTLKGSA